MSRWRKHLTSVPWMRLWKGIFARLMVTYWKPEKASSYQESPLAGTPSHSYCGCQKRAGSLCHQGVCFLAWDSPVALQIAFLPPHLIGRVSVGLSLLQGQPHIHTHRPTPGNDCWLDCGLFPPRIQSEARGIFRQPLRHLQLSLLRVTVQTEENDSFHHFLLNDSVLIQPVSTPQQCSEEKGEQRTQNRRANASQPVWGSVTIGLLFPFMQKSPCYPLQGHVAALERSLLKPFPWVTSLISISGALFEKEPIVLMPQIWELHE